MPYARLRILESLVTMIIAIGLDPLRAQLIVALLLTGGAALVGAACGRHKGGAMVGGGIAFWLGYLANFLQLEQRPVYDPVGNRDEEERDERKATVWALSLSRVETNYDARKAEGHRCTSVHCAQSGLRAMQIARP